MCTCVIPLPSTVLVQSALNLAWIVLGTLGVISWACFHPCRIHTYIHTYIHTLKVKVTVKQYPSFYTILWRGYIFTLVCLFVCLSVCLSVCLCVCMCVYVSGYSCEQNSSQTDKTIWTRFSPNGCLLHWLEPYWIWWLWLKGQGHSDVIPIFSLLILC